MAIKKEVFGKLDELAKPGAILASNTSTLDVDEIAASTKRPQDVVGLHFFSPANMMRCWRSCAARRPRKDVMATAMGLAKRINKIGVRGRRLRRLHRQPHAAMPTGGEAQAILLEGATPQQIDRAIERFGHRDGAVGDGRPAGLDVGWRIRQERSYVERAARCAYARSPTDCARWAASARRPGAGYYRYEPGERTRCPIPMVEAMYRRGGASARASRAAKSPTRRSSSACCSTLVQRGRADPRGGHRAARLATSTSVYVNGYGFPAWRGGPMCYGRRDRPADGGRARCAASRRRLRAALGPASLLAKLAAEGSSFNERAKK